MRPKRSTASPAKASTAASSPTSRDVASTARAPAASHSRAVACSGAGERAQRASAAPRRAKRSAAARPMPLEAPVIATTDSSRGRGICASAEAFFLGGLVGDLEKIRDRQRREDGGEETSQARGEEQSDREGGDDPEAEAVRAD